MRASARPARRRVPALPVAVAAAALATGVAAPASAAVVPQVACGARVAGVWTDDPDGPSGPEPARAYDVLIASLGYTNTADAPVTLAAGGPTNFFNPAARNRGQPSTFLPGRHDEVLSVGFTPQLNPRLFWIVESTILTIQDVPALPACASRPRTAPSAFATPAAATPSTARIAGVVTRAA